MKKLKNQKQTNKFIQYKQAKTTKPKTGEQSQILQADYVNLRHVTEELDLALKELKSAHVRRIMRNIK